MTGHAALQLMLPLSFRLACAECGASHLDVFYTSKDRGTHLCPVCFRSRVERGMAREGEPELPEEC